MVQYGWLIPVLPFAAFIMIAFLFKRYKMLSAVTALASMAASFGISLGILIEKIKDPAAYELAVDWLKLSSVGGFRGLDIQMGILIDPLSAVMLFVVTFVAVLVALFSIGYMKGDEGFSRYFAYLSLFAFSMLGLVVSNNFFQMFVFWELVGLSSYLLIGFWFHKPSAADAALKAFVTNRWADFAFMIGVILMFVKFGTFHFGELARMIPLSGEIGFITLIGLLIFAGPVGKSAQFPLHVWLPDAMEGPTPVSAFIHAATMVAAGVFLIARSFILFETSETVMTVIAYIGGFTAIFAASIALVQKDVKRILAYSTLSQLGYMVMAMGIGSLTAGMFHLTTHAFFKALLFLGAGSVIIAMHHEQDIFRMGGLSRKMPITTWTFVIGALALAGIFPLAGFWSKDEILLAALHHEYYGLLVIGLIVAFMTAFYMFRLIFVAFFGEKRSDHHAHETSWVMTLPLVLLAVFAVFSGLVNSPMFYDMFHQSFSTFVFFEEPEHPEFSFLVAGISTAAALAGIWLAWRIYAKQDISAESIAGKYRRTYKLLWNKYYIDTIYSWLFRNIMILIGDIFDWIDHKLIDGFFDGLARLLGFTGRGLRLTTSGALQNYALAMFGAVLVIVILASTPLLGGVLK